MYACLLLISALQLNSTNELSSLLDQASPTSAKKVRLEAFKQLQTVGKEDPTKTATSLASCLRDQDADIRNAAVVAIGLSGYEHATCPLPLVEAINDPDDGVRANAIGVLGLYCKFPDEAAPILFAAVQSKHHDVRTSVPSLLEKAVGKTPRVLKTLKQMCADSDLMISNNAYATQFHLTGDLGVYVPHLLQLTADRKQETEPKTGAEKRERDLKDFYSTAGAIQLYEQTRLRPHDLAKALVDNLSHKDATIRQCALRQLRAMCIGSKTSFRAVDQLKLQSRLDKIGETDENEDVRGWAFWVRDILNEGPPKTAPDKLKPYSELLPADADDLPGATSKDESP